MFCLQRVARLQTDQVLPQHYLRESKVIVKCFLNYCRTHKDEIDVLFQMLSIFIVRTTMDFTFLRDFYTQEIAEVIFIINITLFGILNVIFFLGIHTGTKEGNS